MRKRRDLRYFLAQTLNFSQEKEWKLKRQKEIIKNKSRGIPGFLSLYNTIFFPSGSIGKESSCNAGDLGLIPRLGRSPGEGNSFQYSGLENSIDYSPWGRKELDTTERLSDLAKNPTHSSTFTYFLNCIVL